MMAPRSPSTRTCSCRCSCARTASRSPTRPNRSTLLPDDGRALRRRLRDPVSAARPAQPTTQGPFAMPDYYFELRRHQAAAMAAALPVIEQVGGESRCSPAPHGPVERVPAGRRRARARRTRLDRRNREGRRRRAAGRGRGGRALEILLPAVPGRGGPRALAGVDDVVVLDRADSPGGARRCAPRSRPRCSASGRDARSYVYGLGGRDLHPADDPAGLRRVSPRLRRAERSARCPA